MKTVKEVSSSIGISVRTLHHYDDIGLLKPTCVSESGYRLYDDAAIDRLHMILLFRELGFPLKEISDILNAPDFDRNHTLEQQVKLLQKKKEHLDALIALANGIKLMGVKYLDMGKMDLKKLDDYHAQAKLLWGKSEAWKEFEQKNKDRSAAQKEDLENQVMDLFVQLGTMRDLPPDHENVQAWVRSMQDFFTQHFYHCTPEILRGLGKMYAGGGSMTENIDAAGGPGTALLASRAIEEYCK